MPCPTKYSTRLAITDSNSASTSARIDCGDDRGTRNRRATPRRRPKNISGLLRVEHGDQRVKVIDEARGFGPQMGASGICQAIVASPPAVLRDSPFGIDELSGLETVK